jgi:hypothetical protein
MGHALSDSRAQCYKNFLRPSSFMIVRKTLECLFLASLYPPSLMFASKAVYPIWTLSGAAI